MKRPLLTTLLLLTIVLIGAYFYNVNKPEVDYSEYQSATTTDDNLPVTITTTVSTTTTVGRVRGPEDVTIAVGNTGTAAGVSIKLNDFVNDYRCPKDVQCIQAGAVVVNVTIGADGKKITRNFPSDEVPFEFQGYAISIKDIKPDLLSGKTIAKEDYRITFQVAPTAKGDTI